MALVIIFQSSILPIYAAVNIDRLAETATFNQDGTDQTIEEQDTTTGDAVPEDTTEGDQPSEDIPLEEEVPQEQAEDTTEGDQPSEDIPLEEEVPQEQTEEEKLQAEIQPITYDVEAAENLMKEFSRNGNHVTQYENEDDKQLKTIVWAKGVTPPEMKDFVKEEVLGSGGAKFITYQAPYQGHKGWYDVNKTQSRAEDANLCFAAAASNALHWWLEQNESYIDRYLEKYPDDEKKKDLRTLRDSYISQSDSEIYRRYIKRYSKRQEGYWSDILVDEFINGYEPKENGATNDEGTDGEGLLQKGPRKNGGFFNDIFGTTLLTRRTYSGDFQRFSNDLKQIIINGELVLLNYDTKVLSHVVTLWGAEYDLNGQISAVYLTDSDDETSPYAMVRYMIKNIGGKAFVSTHVNGTYGSVIEYMQIVSLGEEIWEKRLDADPNAPKITLDLKWGNTEFPYNARPQKPLLEATNVEAGDNVVLLVEGGQKDTGDHTATAVLRGASKDKYQLPTEHTKKFTINKARAKVYLEADPQLNQENKRVEFNIRVNGVYNEKPDGTITLRTAEGTIQDNIPVVNGSAKYTWEKLPLGNHRVIADFYPSADGVGKNYNQAKSNVIKIDLPKKDQSKLVIEPVVGKKFGDGSFTLQTTGGTGNGNVTYSCSTNDVLSISGSTATIIGAGSTTITAVKAGDAEYNSTTATYVITIDKAKAPFVIYPTATPIMYGQKLSESVLAGGSMAYGNFAWENGELVPPIHNTGYSVRFTPNSETLKNYETIPVTTSIVKVTVSRANPLVTLTTNIIGEKDSRKVTLSAVVEKVSNGNGVTGTVNFVNCTGPQDTEIARAVPIVNGEATYTWTGMPEQLYKIKAVYSGDGNYNTASSMEVSVDLSKDPENDNSGGQDNNGGNNSVGQDNNVGNNSGSQGNNDVGQDNNVGNNSGGQDNNGVGQDNNDGNNSGGQGNNDVGQDNNVGNNSGGQDNNGVGQDNNVGNNSGGQGNNDVGQDNNDGNNSVGQGNNDGNNSVGQGNNGGNNSVGQDNNDGNNSVGQDNNGGNNSVGQGNNGGNNSGGQGNNGGNNSVGQDNNGGNNSIGQDNNGGNNSGGQGNNDVGQDNNGENNSVGQDNNGGNNSVGQDNNGGNNSDGQGNNGGNNSGGQGNNGQSNNSYGGDQVNQESNRGDKEPNAASKPINIEKDLLNGQTNEESLDANLKTDEIPEISVLNPEVASTNNVNSGTSSIISQNTSGGTTDKKEQSEEKKRDDEEQKNDEEQKVSGELQAEEKRKATSKALAVISVVSIAAIAVYFIKIK